MPSWNQDVLASGYELPTWSQIARKPPGYFLQMLGLLDSNVWRHIVDADVVSKVQNAARKSPNKIAIAPAVVYEVLGQRPLPALVLALTLPSWKRLIPETYSEATEIKIEVTRLRP